MSYPFPDNIRFELHFSSLDKLRDRLTFIQKYKIHRVNLPCNKTINSKFLSESMMFIHREFFEFNVIPHFSIQHQYHQSPYITFKKLERFISLANQTCSNEILLVSGSQKRKRFDSICALNMLSQSEFSLLGKVSFGVAFNPYLPRNLIDEEKSRIIEKISTGIVSSIWIQFGTDLKTFYTEIDWLHNKIRDLSRSKRLSSIKLIGSLFIPSKLFISRFRFRPWKGVYVSDRFLDSLDYATSFTKSLISAYIEKDLELLIESDVSTSKQMDNLNSLFV